MLTIHQILKKYWGFDAFRPLQEQIIRSVLDGDDTLALLPTGGGKSICFQVPAMALEGMCLVVSPLIALMKDQVQNLNKRGIKSAAIHTGMSARDIDTILDNCMYGKVKFLYISPERAATDLFRERMKRMKVSLLAVDEAHCISQWGYDFRPPYMRIAELREMLKGVAVIALTATATPQVADDIQEKLLFGNKNVLQKSFARKNLSYVVRQTANKEQAVVDILQKVKGSAIIYVRNRRKTKELADYLNSKKISADYYHAGLLSNDRARKQDNWIANKTRVICCTNAFGMGIDKPDVRLVLHLDLAESPEAYFQEAGRAGRDEKKAYAVQLIAGADLRELDVKMKTGYPEPRYIKDVYEALFSYFNITYHSGANKSFGLDIAAFSEKYKFNTALLLPAQKILQQHELIYLTEGTLTSSHIKATTSKDNLFQFQEKNRSLEPLIKFILRTSEGIFENFVSLDEQAIAPRMKITVEEVIRQLVLLDKFKVFSYQPRKNQPQVMFLADRVKKEDLRLNTELIKQRKTDFDNRLKAIRYYITENTFCRSSVLIKYFGETVTEDCGICDVCVARKKSSLSSEEFSKLVSDILSELNSSAVSMEALREKLQIKNQDFKTVMEYLGESGKVLRTEKGDIRKAQA